MNQNEQITKATRLSPLRITILLCVIAQVLFGFIIPRVRQYESDRQWEKKKAEAVAYMEAYKYKDAKKILNEIVSDQSRSEEERALYFSYLHYARMMEEYFGDKDIEYLYRLANDIDLPKDDPFYASWKRIGSNIEKEYAPIKQKKQEEAESKRRAKEMLDGALNDIDRQLQYLRGYGLTEKERAEAYDSLDSGKPYTPHYYDKSSGGSYGGSSGSHKSYDPYDVDNYDDPDDFADDWEGEFEDYDDAYDYWEENH